MKLNRNCENCLANYSTGNDYGDTWCEITDKSKEIKGLCEFCNPNSKYFLKPNGRKHKIDNI